MGTKARKERRNERKEGDFGWKQPAITMENERKSLFMF